MKFERNITFENDIIFVDGLWGTGKSMLAPIISSFSGVEKVRIDHIFEYASVFYDFKKFDDDAAAWLVRTYADLLQYNNMISREVNLRLQDDSGLRFCNNKFEVLKRLFLRDGDHAVAEISAENRAFFNMSHMLFLTPKLLEGAFGQRCYLLEMIRHPLFVINHYEAYLKRFSSSREFTVSYTYDGVKIPWFLEDHEEQFIEGCDLQKAVLATTVLYQKLYSAIEYAEESNFNHLIVSFEDIVFGPHEVVDQIKNFIGRTFDGNMHKILRRQKLPRKSVFDGIGKVSYGWKKTKMSDYEVGASIIERVKNACSTKAYIDLVNVIGVYEVKYPSNLPNFA